MLTNFQIKILAVILMTIDHIGFFFPSIPFSLGLRAIGRLSFPLFAFSIAEGYKHSHNLMKYFIRLFSFAFIFDLIIVIFLPTFSRNIFYTLSFGLLGLIFTQRKLTMPLLIPLLLFAYWLNPEYAIYGIVIILIFGLIKNRVLMLTFFMIATLVYSFIGYPNCNWVQAFAIFSSIIIILYNEKKGASWQPFFYLYFPIHLFILFTIYITLQIF